MGLLEELKKMIPRETIGGVDVEECGRLNVHLDVEFTPVVPDRVPCDPKEGHMPFCPIPCRVQQEGSRWCVWMPHDARKYQWVSEPELKTMRARYLLLKGWFFNHIEVMDHPSRQEVLSKFFPGGLFKPTILQTQ